MGRSSLFTNRVGTAMEAVVVDGNICPTGKRHWTPTLRAGGYPIRGSSLGFTKTGCEQVVSEDMYVINGDIEEVNCEDCITAYAAHRLRSSDLP